MSLADIKIPNEPDPILVAINRFTGERTEIERIGPGQYLTPLNHGLNVDLSADDQYPEIGTNYEPCPYGVVDSPEQFIDLFGEVIESDPRLMFVCFTPVYRKNQPEEGGWRWHKWGPYYGKQNADHEYLYDEEDIDVVFTYHIYLHGKESK